MIFSNILFIMLVIATAFTTTSAKVVFVFDESLIECAEPKDKAGFFDFSELEVIAEDDTHAYLNGIWKVTKDLESPWYLAIYTERYERGQWNAFAYNKRIKDFCAVMHNPTEPWYGFFKQVPGCPAKKGVRIVLNFS